MSQGYYYLSNPYNGSPEMIEQRAEAACKTTSLLLQKGVYTLSPIVHNHQIVKHFPPMTLDQRRNLIMPYDLELLRASIGMIVLKIPGWDQSKGVREEIDFAIQHQKPTYEVTLSDLESGDFKWTEFKDAA